MLLKKASCKTKAAKAAADIIILGIHLTLQSGAVIVDDDLKEFVPVDPLDESSCALIVGDISGVARDKISDQLIDRVVALLLERAQNIRH